MGVVTIRNSWTSARSILALCVVLACCTAALAQPALLAPLVGPVDQRDHGGDGISRALDEGTSDSSETQQNSLKLVMPRRMVNSKTLTLKASIVDVGGGIVTSGCYATLGTVTMNRVSDNLSIPITVTFFDDHLPVPADSIRFFHGVGSVSFTLDDGDAVPAGDYRVTVTVGTMSASRIVTVLADPSWRELQGTLSGAGLVWGPSENIHIVGHDTYVPAGSTLTIHPGTLIMVDSLGALENGTLITVNGQLNAVGSQDDPIHFFSASGAAAMIHTVSGSLSNVNAWRGIHHYGSGSSSYRWVILTGAGNGPIQGHPRPAIIQLHDTHNVLVENSIFTDSTGMMFQGFGTGSYTVRRSLVSRVGIGCEFTGSGHTLLIEDTWWTSIGRGPSTPQRFDGDMLHVDGPASNQTIRRCIIADGGDDGIDHSGSTFTVENTIIHTIKDKAISMTGGFVTLRNVLIHTARDGSHRDRKRVQLHHRVRTDQQPADRPGEHLLALDRRRLFGQHRLHGWGRHRAHRVRHRQHLRRSPLHRHLAVRLQAAGRLPRSDRGTRRDADRVARLPGRRDVRDGRRLPGRQPLHARPVREQALHLHADRRLRAVLRDRRRLQQRLVLRRHRAVHEPEVRARAGARVRRRRPVHRGFVQQFDRSVPAHPKQRPV